MEEPFVELRTHGGGGNLLTGALLLVVMLSVPLVLAWALLAGAPSANRSTRSHEHGICVQQPG